MEDSYDYVIVGGGSAGCVLANGLTADGSCKVLLLEAGGNASSLLVKLPFGYAFMLNNPRFDWRFQLGPEIGLNNKLMSYPRGRLLGGSSSINAMLYVRGLRRDYDAWAAEGLEGWSWDDIEPYFLKLEDYPNASVNKRGRGGPVKISSTPNFHPVSAKIVDAAGESSVGSAEDYNGPEPSGIGAAQIFFRNGRRSGSAAAYLDPAIKRKNLHVETHCTVNRIVVENRRAVGVSYTRKDHSHIVHAGEVILSAGAIGSPQLLELSGIGQSNRLSSFGIRPVHDLAAVGENLQDHYLVFISQSLRNVRGLGAELNGWRAWANGAAYILFKRGYLNGTPTQLTGHGDVLVEGVSIGLQFLGMPLSFKYDLKRKTVVRNPHPAMMLGVNVCHPNSRGHVHIRNAKVENQPEIIANFMTDEQDVRATIEGLRLCREIIARPALDNIRGAEMAPGKNVSSDEELTAYARTAGASAYHPVGTCRMAKDPVQGVVDSRLKVHGLDNLRVVDASIMPRIVLANTHAATVMIAEKAADMIIADRKLYSS